MGITFYSTRWGKRRQIRLPYIDLQAEIDTLEAKREAFTHRLQNILKELDDRGKNVEEFKERMKVAARIILHHRHHDYVAAKGRKRRTWPRSGLERIEKD